MRRVFLPSLMLISTISVSSAQSNSDVSPEELNSAIFALRFLIFGPLFGLIIGGIAKAFRRSFWKWFFYGFFLLPIALIHLLIVRSPKKFCDSCGERVLRVARVCRYCGSATS